MIDFICPVKIDDDKRVNLLVQTVESLIKNTPKEHINRIIFIDDGSSRDVSTILNQVLGNNILVHRNDVPIGVGGSKNLGVKLHTELGRGDFLYIFDGDVFFTDGWSNTMLEAHRIDGEQFLVIGGGIHPFLQPRAGEDTPTLTSHDAVSGWSWLLTYETWDKYGTMADNAVGVGKSEDWEYSQRIRNDGFRVGCLKKQVIAHCGLTNSDGEEIPGYEQSRILAKTVANDAVLL